MSIPHQIAREIEQEYNATIWKFSDMLKLLDLSHKSDRKKLERAIKVSYKIKPLPNEKGMYYVDDATNATNATNEELS